MSDSSTNGDDRNTNGRNGNGPASGVSAMLAPWTGPYGGVPPWDEIDPASFAAAFEAALADARSDIATIAENPEPPTFENTIVALERSGATLERVGAMFGVHTGNLNVGPIPDIQREVAPDLAAHGDEVVQNQRLFERVSAVYEQAEAAGDDGSLTPAERRLLTDHYRRFVRRGAALDDEAKAELATINRELAGLFTEFSQNILRDEADQVTWADDAERLAGLPEAVVSSMAAAAAERGREGAYAVLNTRSSMDPVLTSAVDRDLREQVWRTFYGRGDTAGQNDNKPIITRILDLRARRAALLGYETHAHWRLEVTMAKTPEAAMDLMMAIWPKARARAIEEVADMQRVADAEGAGIRIEPWDYRFYAEKVRVADYDLDFNEVKPYLQLEKLIEAMLWCSGQLFGLRFDPVTVGADGVPVFHDDVRVWEVTGADGRHVGLWYLDPYAREGKLSGAWMTAYRDQEHIDRPISTLVSNNSNFVKGADGAPVLISWDDARTLFHEFGHALHGLLSDVRYPSQSGTAVCQDYVEFPSQLNEHWLTTDEVLSRFCVHHETGEPMPAELIERIKRAETFNQGFDTVEYLASALVDMRLHLSEETGIDPDAFERETLADLGMPDEIVMRHRTPQFAHIFSGDGYSAGYYSYLWADALTADAAEAFEEAGGYYDRSIADKLLESVLSVGDTVDPEDGFRAFRGRDVDTDALLRKRGFPVG